MILQSLAAHAQPDIALETRVKQLSSSSGRAIGNSEIATVEMITAFYAQRGYKPAWTNRRDVEALQIAIADSSSEGLLPEGFYATALANRSTLPPADQEILLSDALARLLFQLFYGKLQPNKFESSWNFARPVAGRDPVAAVSAALDSHQLAKLIDDVKLKHPFYDALKDGLARFRAIASKGGGVAVPSGSTLKKGAKDPRVAEVRNRLMATGDRQPDLPYRLPLHRAGLSPTRDYRRTFWLAERLRKRQRIASKVSEHRILLPIRHDVCTDCSADVSPARMIAGFSEVDCLLRYPTHPRSHSFC